MEIKKGDGHNNYITLGSKKHKFNAGLKGRKEVQIDKSYFYELYYLYGTKLTKKGSLVFFEGAIKDNDLYMCWKPDTIQRTNNIVIEVRSDIGHVWTSDVIDKNDNLHLSFCTRESKRIVQNEKELLLESKYILTSWTYEDSKIECTSIFLYAGDDKKIKELKEYILENKTVVNINIPIDFSEGTNLEMILNATLMQVVNKLVNLVEHKIKIMTELKHNMLDFK